MGYRIAEFRKALGMDQQELADRVGASKRSITRWETEGIGMPFDKAVAIANVLGVTTNDLSDRQPLDDPSKGLDVYEITLVRNYRQSSTEGRELLMHVSRFTASVHE